MNFYRYVILVTTTFATIVVYMGRTNINVTMVSMVAPVNQTPVNQTDEPVHDYCFSPPVNQSQATEATGKGPKYNWTPAQQGDKVTA